MKKCERWQNRFGRRRVVLNYEECKILHELMHDYCAEKIPELQKKMEESTYIWGKARYKAEIEKLYLLKSKVSPG